MQDRTLLFVDDDREILRIYQKYMEKKGYSVSVCADGNEALQFLETNQTDCIILDVMMPGEDGFRLLPAIKKLSDAPVIYLSGKAETEDRIRGLSLGADDYLSKPCSLEELSLRIEIQIRKSQPAGMAENVLELPPLKIEPAERRVYYGTEEILLSNREYDLLLLLAENKGNTLTFEQIGTAMNGTYLAADRQTVMMAVSRLRKKLARFARAADLIETVWGEGYKIRL